MKESWSGERMTLTPEDHLLLNSRLKAVQLVFRNFHRPGNISNDLKRYINIYAYKKNISTSIYTCVERGYL